MHDEDDDNRRRISRAELDIYRLNQRVVALEDDTPSKRQVYTTREIAEDARDLARSAHDRIDRLEPSQPRSPWLTVLMLALAAVVVYAAIYTWGWGYDDDPQEAGFLGRADAGDAISWGGPPPPL